MRYLLLSITIFLCGCFNSKVTRIKIKNGGQVLVDTFPVVGKTSDTNTILKNEISMYELNKLPSTVNSYYYGIIVDTLIHKTINFRQIEKTFDSSSFHFTIDSNKILYKEYGITLHDSILKSTTLIQSGKDEYQLQNVFNQGSFKRTINFIITKTKAFSFDSSNTQLLTGEIILPSKRHYEFIVINDADSLVAVLDVVSFLTTISEDNYKSDCNKHKTQNCIPYIDVGNYILFQKVRCYLKCK